MNYAAILTPFVSIAVLISCNKACAEAKSAEARASHLQVEFVDCPKCDKRMRILEDGKKAFINRSKVSELERPKMVERAKRFLKLAKPIKLANPKTPLMGWSSWNTFGAEISEGVIVETARAMVTNGLRDAGYVYVNLDDGFF